MKPSQTQQLGKNTPHLMNSESNNKLRRISNLKPTPTPNFNQDDKKKDKRNHGLVLANPK